MRVSRRLLTLVLAFALRVVAQSASDPIETETEVDPEPTTSLEPTTTEADPTISSDPDTTITTSSTTEQTIAPTATPPVGGGASCVQVCFVRAAAGVGCKTSTDFDCVCSNSNYLNLAQGCFSEFSCQTSAIDDAEEDFVAACKLNDNPSSGSTTSSRSRSSVSASSARTSRAVVITSGAVVTVSGMASTVTSGFTTLQAGDVGPTGGVGGGSPSGSNNGGSVLRYSGMVGLGVIGGAVILLL